MSSDQTAPPGRGPKIHDLVGLVLGYGLAALLARTLWPPPSPIEADARLLAAVGLAYAWLGLAMSGPIILLMGRTAAAGRDRPRDRHRARPARPGRLISDRSETAGAPGPARSIEPIPPADPGPTYTRAELFWIVAGGYWIGLTIFVVPALSIDTPWALVGLLQVVAAIGLLAVAPRPAGARPAAEARWTHRAAVALLATWPIAWVLLILLSRSL